MTVKYLLLAATLIAPLAGCAGDYAAKGKPAAQMTFEHVQSYPVYVASYEVRDDFAPLEAAGPRARLFVASPGQVVADYFKNRFEAGGANGKLVVAVESATVDYEALESENSIGAFIGVDKTDMYKIAVHIRLISYDAGGYDKKEMKVVARRNVGISEHVSLAERERLQMEALDYLLDDLDGAVQKALREEFRLLH